MPFRFAPPLDPGIWPMRISSCDTSELATGTRPVDIQQQRQQLQRAAARALHNLSLAELQQLSEKIKSGGSANSAGAGVNPMSFTSPMGAGGRLTCLMKNSSSDNVEAMNRQLLAALAPASAFHGVTGLGAAHAAGALPAAALTDASRRAATTRPSPTTTFPCWPTRFRRSSSSREADAASVRRRGPTQTSSYRPSSHRCTNPFPTTSNRTRRARPCCNCTLIKRFIRRGSALTKRLCADLWDWVAAWEHSAREDIIRRPPTICTSNCWPATRPLRSIGR